MYSARLPASCWKLPAVWSWPNNRFPNGAECRLRASACMPSGLSHCRSAAAADCAPGVGRACSCNFLEFTPPSCFASPYGLKTSSARATCSSRCAACTTQSRHHRGTDRDNEINERDGCWKACLTGIHSNSCTGGVTRPPSEQRNPQPTFLL